MVLIKYTSVWLQRVRSIVRITLEEYTPVAQMDRAAVS